MFQSQRPINLAASLLLLFPMLHGALGGGTENVPTVLENAALVRRNGNFYNNRPLYAAQENPEQRYYWVFGGDKPLLRFGGGSNLDGTFMPGFSIFHLSIFSSIARSLSFSQASLCVYFIILLWP